MTAFLLGTIDNGRTGHSCIAGFRACLFLVFLVVQGCQTGDVTGNRTPAFNNPTTVSQTPTDTSSITSVPSTTQPERVHPLLGTFLFIEYVTVVEGTGTLPELRLDFPRYIFNPNTQLLRPLQIPFPGLEKNDVGYLGIARQRKGSAGAGAASTIEIIAQLPFTFQAALFAGKFEQESEKYEPLNIVIHGFDSNGQLLASIANENVLLRSGQSWNKTVEAEMSSGVYAGHVVVEHKLINHGELPRENIQSR